MSDALPVPTDHLADTSYVTRPTRSTVFFRTFLPW